MGVVLPMHLWNTPRRILIIGMNSTYALRHSMLLCSQSPLIIFVVMSKDSERTQVEGDWVVRSSRRYFRRNAFGGGELDE